MFYQLLKMRSVYINKTGVFKLYDKETKTFDDDLEKVIAKYEEEGFETVLQRSEVNMVDGVVIFRRESKTIKTDVVTVLKRHFALQKQRPEIEFTHKNPNPSFINQNIQVGMEQHN